MYVEMNVPMCDFDDIQFSRPVMGAGAIARGATGRYCVVMYAGPEYLKKNNLTVYKYDEAVAIVESYKDGFVDF